MPDQAEFGKAGQRILEVGHLFRDEFELIRGQVFGKHLPAAVEYQAARRWHRLNPHAVAL